MTRTANVLYILSVCLVLVLPSGSSAGTLRGQVTDSAGTPLADVNIRVGRTKIGAVTDADGRFEISKLRSGNHWLRISRIGYKSLRTRTAVPDEGVQTVTLQLEEWPIELSGIVVSASAILEEGSRFWFQLPARIEGEPARESPALAG